MSRCLTHFCRRTWCPSRALHLLSRKIGFVSSNIGRSLIVLSNKIWFVCITTTDSHVMTRIPYNTGAVITNPFWISEAFCPNSVMCVLVLTLESYPEGLGSNLGPNTGYPDLVFTWFSLVLPDEFRDSFLKTGHCRSQSNPFRFIIYLLPFHWMLQNWNLTFNYNVHCSLYRVTWFQLTHSHPNTWTPCHVVSLYSGCWRVKRRPDMKGAGKYWLSPLLRIVTFMWGFVKRNFLKRFAIPHKPSVIIEGCFSELRKQRKENIIQFYCLKRNKQAMKINRYTMKHKSM
jgi:hypothetical protein